MIADMVARAIWKGAVSFRLLNIPIEVFSAYKFSFHNPSSWCQYRHQTRTGYPRSNGGVSCNNKKLTDIIVELINFLGGKNVRRI